MIWCLCVTEGGTQTRRTAVAEVGDVEVEGERQGEEAVGEDQGQEGGRKEEGQEEVVQHGGEEEEGQEGVAVDVEGVAPLHLLLHAVVCARLVDCGNPSSVWVSMLLGTCMHVN